MSRRFTALCGLYCLDCIPSKERLFTVVKELDALLTELQFEHYAELKSKNNPAFNEYPKLVTLLHEIAKLKCVAPCTEGGCKPNCEVRRCVLTRNLAGCWECADNQTCELLKPLKSVHPNLEYHLRLIKEHGPDNWAQRRRVHYRWQS